MQKYEIILILYVFAYKILKQTVFYIISNIIYMCYNTFPSVFISVCYGVLAVLFDFLGGMACCMAAVVQCVRRSSYTLCDGRVTMCITVAVQR